MGCAPNRVLSTHVATFTQSSVTEFAPFYCIEMNLGRRCVTYLCSMCQQSHVCRSIWKESRNGVKYVNGLGNRRFDYRKMSSRCSTKINGVDEFEEVEILDSRILDGLERVEGTVFNDISDDNHHMDRQFTDEEVQRVMELFKERESVIENVASEYNLEGTCLWGCCIMHAVQ